METRKTKVIVHSRIRAEKPAMSPVAETRAKKTISVLMTTTSFPVYKNLISGPFVHQLATALGQKPEVEVEILAPDGVFPKTESNKTQYTLRTFRYAPRRWQRLAHFPGGIPVALKKIPLLWLFVPVFILSFLLKTVQYGRKKTIIHANWASTGVISALVGRFCRIPVCATLRGADVTSLGSSIWTRWTIRFLLTNSTYVTTVNRAMESQLKHHFPHHAHKVTHIPNGVSDQFLKLTPPTPGKRIKLIAIGSLIPRKSFTTLLIALRGTERAFSLTIVGDGPEKEALVNATKEYGLVSNVTFLGNQPATAIPNLLNDHDVLVLSSLSEGRPNVVLEAMAAGRAVISSKLPGVEELIEHQVSGLLYSAADPDSLRENLLTLSNNPSLIPLLGKAARNVILNQGLTWEASALHYTNLYRRALKAL
ncbi:glycosyltransferase family 4 protein [Marinobacter sp. KM021]|uniref:glycosyltransferase family 4 protein n=1 Tax=Marinobacter sp. KM021 TaxID=3075616 RepID=UPI003D6C4480